MTSRRAGEKERQRGVHLLILMVLTVSVVGVCLAAFLLQWSESWMIPLFLAGVIVCWVLHISDALTPEYRLWIFALVGWAGILLDGVHASSVFDISILAALEMLVFSGTDDRRLLHVSLGLYVFCLIWQVRMILAGESISLNALVVTQLAAHAVFLFVIYVICLAMSTKRKADFAADEEEISALRLAQRRTESLLAGISHELRAPIAAVMDTASLMAHNAQEPGEREHAKNVLEAGRRLTVQVDDMTDYMEIETGEITVSEEPYRMSSVINDVVAQLDLYDRTDLPDVLLDVEAGVPARLLGSRQHIRTILNQLIGNAVKFTRAGGVYLHIYPNRHGNDLNLCIDVTDTGIGMTRRELERVRTTSYQADADRARRTGGLGLGFPIVNGLTKSMNGFINITSTPGEGSRVHVSIPQKAEDDSPCVQVRHPERLRVVLYQDPSKFDVPAVRDFYTQMVFHVIRDFKLTLQRVSTQEDLKRLLSENTYTHLFTADGEYRRDPAFFDRLAGSMHVVVAAKKEFEKSAGSRVTVLRKPLYTFPLVMVLNADTPKEAQDALERKNRVTGLNRFNRDQEK